MNGYVDFNLSLKRSWLQSRTLHQNRLKSISTRGSQIDNACPKFFVKPDRTSSSVAKLPSLILPFNLTASTQPNQPKQPRRSASTKFKNSLRRQVQSENEKLALAIALTKPTISTKRLAQDYYNSQRYRQLSSKPHVLEDPWKSKLSKTLK